MRRAADISSDHVRSAVVSSRTPGVLVTRMPRFVHAARSMLLWPTAMLEMTLSSGHLARIDSSNRSITVAIAPLAPESFAASSSGGHGRSSSLWTTSWRAPRRSTSSRKTRRVITTFILAMAAGAHERKGGAHGRHHDRRGDLRRIHRRHLVLVPPVHAGRHPPGEGRLPAAARL